MSSLPEMWSGVGAGKGQVGVGVGVLGKTWSLVPDISKNSGSKILKKLSLEVLIRPDL